MGYDPFDIGTEYEECCGNCGNCKKDRETGSFICTCEASDMRGLDTAYEDSCEEWSER